MWSACICTKEWKSINCDAIYPDFIPKYGYQVSTTERLSRQMKIRLASLALFDLTKDVKFEKKVR